MCRPTPGDEEPAVYHTVEFTKELVVVLQTSLKEPLSQTPLRKGTRRRARVRPYVAETEDGLVEMADLHFEDGTAAAEIPFACFRFAE
jgi:hypothetical protein